MSKLGDFIVRKRMEKNLTIRELAKLSGVSHSTIHKIELGDTSHPGIDIIMGLSRGLRIPHAKLILAYQGVDPDEITQNDHGIEDISDEELEELERSAQQFLKYLNVFKKRKKKE